VPVAAEAQAKMRVAVAVLLPDKKQPMVLPVLRDKAAMAAAISMTAAAEVAEEEDIMAAVAARVTAMTLAVIWAVAAAEDLRTSPNRAISRIQALHRGCNLATGP
jgi:hypothetical protein